MDPAEDRYDALTDEVAALYDDGRQAEALALMDAADDLTPWTAELAHLRACLLGSLGRADEALAVLQQATDAGAWWAESILTEDDDLAGLQQLPGFGQVLALSRERRTTDATPPVVRLGAAPQRVVVALHGAGQRATHAARDWAPVLDLGCALICVESSQLMSPMYRTWPDPQAAREDIARALTQLPDELKALPLIAAGFSAGGRSALDWALTGLPQRADGVLALAPALRALPPAAANSLSPAVAWIGSEDDLLETVTGAPLAALGVKTRILPAEGHQVPAGFKQLLAELLGG
ncbi:phospholipase [Kribbella lupini]|uniref:BCE-2095-like N-terminal domain-containing protein n=1 Tax=Kribbella lupini TaxID=291602 RepID=A0ABP4M8C3_9ACTN